MTDANNLFDAYLISRKASKWKRETMKCDLNFLSVISEKQKQLKEWNYVQDKTHEFEINERGRVRQITSTGIADRIVRHVLCDNILVPELSKKLIYNSGSSIKGKGVDFQRRHFEQDLRQFYRDNSSNNGFILFIDFSKYYDNILHKKLYEDVTEVIDDNYINWLYYQILKNERVDVSSLSKVEIEYYKSNTINLLEYRNKNYKKEGKKYLSKSLNIGDQSSQIGGNYYAHRIDSRIKIVENCKYNGRYCDDIYIMDKDRNKLKEILKHILEISEEYGIKINEKKTKIVKMSSTYEFLKVRYSLTDTGKVIKKIDKEKLTKMRRKLKKLKTKLDNGEVEYKSIENMYKSWFGTHKKYMSSKQKENLNNLYNELFIKDWRCENYD